MEGILSSVCSGGIQKYAEHLRKPVFLLQRYSIHTGHHVGIDQQLSWSFYFSRSKTEYQRTKNCFAGNPPPRENPGLKRTRTDDILKKFDQNMNSKLKINVQRDRTNFRSIQLHHLQPFPIL
jgi:hypothetical protein